MKKCSDEKELEKMEIEIEQVLKDNKNELDSMAKLIESPKEYMVCPLCLMRKGLKAEELDTCGFTFTNHEDFAKHIESEHHIPIQRLGETIGMAKERFYKQYPEAKDKKTCKCPICKVARGEMF